MHVRKKQQQQNRLCSLYKKIIQKQIHYLQILQSHHSYACV